MNPARRYWHDVVGYNYRMTNMQAAIGTAQLESIEPILARRDHIARLYDAGFERTPGLRRPPRAEWARPVCWLYTVTVDEGSGASRESLMARLAAQGIDTRPMFYPVHTMPPYRRYATREFPVATRLSRTGVSLPSSTNLRDDEIGLIIDQVNEILRNTPAPASAAQS